MSEKVKSFKNFLNESDRIDLPFPDEVKGLSVFKEMERIFPRINLYGGGKQPLEFLSSYTSYNIKYSRTGSIYYGGYPVGTFRNVDNNSLEFIRDYLISKATDLSISSLNSIIEGRTPISNNVLKKDWEKYRAGRFEIFKKGVLERIKDFSNTIKYYQNHPLDKSYELIPELKKIVEDGFKKSPAKEIKEGDLTLEQKNYLKDKINRQTDPKQRGYNLDLKGKPMYKLNKETGLVDVYGNFTHGYYSSAVQGNKNFMGIKFGKVYGNFKVNSEKSLPERNLSGFPIEVDKDFELTDAGRIKSLEGFPDVKGQKISINGTSVKDFSPLEKIYLLDKNLDLSENIELINLSQIKFPNRLKELNISETPLESLEGCPNEVEKLSARLVKIKDLKGAPKKSKEIDISSPNLKDISGIFEIEGLTTFLFKSGDEAFIRINLPLEKYGIETIKGILNSEGYFSDRDKKLYLGVCIKGDLLYDYFEENPLELYLLDDFPEAKKDIIQKRGIPDFGKLGGAFNKGFL
jgi:hypothetical protein